MNHAAMQLALRAKAEAIVAADTGLTNLSATLTGFHRAAGSFVTDGFAAGMEVVPTGFADTTPGIVNAVTASDLTIDGGRAIDADAGGRRLSVGLPPRHAYTNVPFGDAAKRWYVEEAYVPATTTVRTMPAAGGVVEATGLYLLQLHGIADRGILGLYSVAQALLSAFRPGTMLALPSGETFYVRTDTGSSMGEAVPAKPGWIRVPVTIPWRLIGAN